MITLHGFGTIFPEGIGETKDLRVQWALEELGLPYRFHGLDHTAGDLETEAFGALNPFRQAPVIEDDGFVVTESGAILVHLATRAGRLIPADAEGRMRVVQWCFAAVGTVEPTLTAIDAVAIFGGEHGAPHLNEQLHALAKRWLGGVERRLEGRTWIACDGITVADLMMAGVLRTIRKSDLMEPFPRIRAYTERCFERPAWQRTLALSAERLGTTVDAIR